MEKLLIIIPGTPSVRLQNMIEYSTGEFDCNILKSLDKVQDLKNGKILFAVELGNSGINIELYKMLEKIKLSGKFFMENSVGSILINSDSELFTRDVARKIILYCNLAGCTFPGRPICEAAGSLLNFKTQQRLFPNLTLEEICYRECRTIAEKLVEFNFMLKTDEKTKILVLHASNYKTSNTLSLWEKVKENLKGCSINEIHIENGSVKDCRACAYKACKHFSQSQNCFYGGIMVEDVYPAIVDCDILILLCPNYNDSISANMSAVINRLTALFRAVKFYDKYIYSIIVSGFSGSDIIAQQIISAININKTFILPPYFALMETANDAGTIEQTEGINEKANEFANNIKNNIYKK